MGQATALVAFAEDVAADAGTDKVLLAGDFNSYEQEDPLQVLKDAGYTDLGASTGEHTYLFDGYVGSLDHVFASSAAAEAVTGTDVWNINSVEPIANEYSRYNYNASILYDTTPFRSSDHDPVLVGLQLGAAEPGTTQLDLLAINDFHGRIDANTVKFAGTIEQLRAANPDGTAFVSAGDNIGASLFASALQEDQPTIDVLNALDVAASAVGNHEFDQGMDDLTGRVTDEADWAYLGANVYDKGTTNPALPEYQVVEIDGLDVGFVGVVTEETPTLVTPSGIADVDFGDPVEALNRVTAQLQDGDPANGEADVVVGLVHEGASAGTPDGATLRGGGRRRRRLRGHRHRDRRARRGDLHGPHPQAVRVGRARPGRPGQDPPDRPDRQLRRVHRARVAHRGHRDPRGHGVHGAERRPHDGGRRDPGRDVPARRGGQDDRRRGAPAGRGHRRDPDRRGHRGHHDGVLRRLVHRPRRDVRGLRPAADHGS